MSFEADKTNAFTARFTLGTYTTMTEPMTDGRRNETVSGAAAGEQTDSIFYFSPDFVHSLVVKRFCRRLEMGMGDGDGRRGRTASRAIQSKKSRRGIPRVQPIKVHALSGGFKFLRNSALRSAVWNF